MLTNTTQIPASRRPTRRGAWLALCTALILIMITTACRLPEIFSEESTTGQAEDLEKTRVALDLKATELALNATEIAQSSPPAPAPDASPPQSQELEENGAGLVLQSLGLDLVWFLSDGTLAIQKVDGTIIPVDIGIPIGAEYGMPGSTAPVSFGKGKVMVANFMEPYNTILIDPDGRLEIVLAPEVSGEMVAAALSPDGTKIAWLFDTTRVNPNPFMEPPCDPAEGCVGRVYELYISDAAGQYPERVFEVTLNSPGYPRLELDGWRSDQQAVFLRQNPGLASPLYPDQGAGLKAVDLQSGMVIRGTGDNLVRNSFFSPEGNWIVHTNDGDQMIALQVDAPAGIQFLKPVITPGNPFIPRVAFSPFENRLFWLELQTENSWSEVTGITVRTMDLIMVDEDILLTLDPPYYTDDLPYFGPVLNDHLLVINYKQNSKILDTRLKTWIDYEDPKITQPHILIGTIQP